MAIQESMQEVFVNPMLYRTTNNIAKMRTVDKIKNIKREEIITKGENLVILWEHLNREEARKNAKSHHRHN